MTLLIEQNMSCKKKSALTAEVFEIERFAVHDGSGIRSVIFLRGCPLRCIWCANPESQQRVPQIMFWKSRCIGCLRCVNECPEKALSVDKEGLIRSDACIYCNHCVDICTAMAQTRIGVVRTVDEVFEEIIRDKAFYESTGGGVTFSGGEALMQGNFVIAVAKKCHAEGVSTAIETSGFASSEVFEKVVSHIDEVLFDFKCMDSKRHEQLTGVGNAQIFRNFERLLELGRNFRVRYPVIGGCNDDEQNVAMMLSYLRQHCPGCNVDLLPYHTLGVGKYTRLQLAYPAERAIKPTENQMRQLQERFAKNGFRVTVGG